MVDVVIPIKSEKNYYWELLPRAIESVLQQTYTNFRLIVQVYDKDVSEGRNKALRGSNSEFCLTLDADDWLEPTFLEECLKIDADIVGTGAYLNGSVWHPGKGNFRDNNQILNCSLFKRKVWEAYQFNEELGGLEDWDYWLRAVENGFMVETLDKPLVNISDIPNSRNKQATLRYNELKDKICS
jgi:glycosyltransferase involved in cell wall biosynthesis